MLLRGKDPGSSRIPLNHLNFEIFLSRQNGKSIRAAMLKIAGLIAKVMGRCALIYDMGSTRSTTYVSNP